MTTSSKSSKRVLAPGEQWRLRRDLQAAALAALMDSRRWEPGDLVFQGGTCLHLAHGSARFSEDLDFMVRGGLSLQGIAQNVLRRLQLPASVGQDLSVTASPGRDGRNPHAFTLTLGGPGVIGSAKVKVELWQTDPLALDSIQVAVRTIGTAAGVQTFVPSETLEELLADKVYALGARARLKPRDVFDLWWLKGQAAAPLLVPDALLQRLLIYPRGDACATARHWLAAARERQASMAQDGTPDIVAKDLARWLPSSWPMSTEHARPMLKVAAQQLDAGVQIIGAFAATCGQPSAGRVR